MYVELQDFESHRCPYTDAKKCMKSQEDPHRLIVTRPRAQIQEDPHRLTVNRLLIVCVTVSSKVVFIYMFIVITISLIVSMIISSMVAFIIPLIVTTVGTRLFQLMSWDC